MLRSPNGKWDVQGCFIFEALYPLAIRHSETVGEKEKTGKVIDAGELIAVDLIQASRFPDSSNGPFLRLTDGSGYLFEFKHGERVMKQIPVETGLWDFCVDNYPEGVFLLEQPREFARSRQSPAKKYLPMQKIFCDKKITSSAGLTFYRVQGTRGWVLERGSNKVYNLISTSKIQTGLFAFRSLADISVRSETSVGESYKTDRYVLKDEIILADVIRESPYGMKHGPFLRLIDGSGWVFERRDNVRLMEKVPIQTGNWTFEVVNPEGVTLEQQPMERPYASGLGVVCEHGVRIWCDRRIQSPDSNVCFYRLEKTDGWVCDRREGQEMLRLFQSHESPSELLNDPQSSWTPEIVREIASYVDGLKETAFIREGRLLIFETETRVRILVYYGTRSVGIMADGETQILQNNCSQFNLLEVFQSPPTQVSRRRNVLPFEDEEEEKKSHDPLSSGSLSCVEEKNHDTLQDSPSRCEEEQKLRFTLLAIDKRMESMRREQLEVLKMIDAFDVERTTNALQHEEKRIISEEEDELSQNSTTVTNKSLRRQQIVIDIKREKELQKHLESELREGQRQREFVKFHDSRVPELERDSGSDESSADDDDETKDRLLTMSSEHKHHPCDVCGENFHSWHALSRHQYTSRH